MWGVGNREWGVGLVLVNYECCQLSTITNNDPIPHSLLPTPYSGGITC